jgi:hypothetical protein
MNKAEIIAAINRNKPKFFQALVKKMNQAYYFIGNHNNKPIRMMKIKDLIIGFFFLIVWYFLFKFIWNL